MRALQLDCSAAHSMRHSLHACLCLPVFALTNRTHMIGSLIQVIFGAAAGALIDALFLIFATKLVAKFNLAYTKAYPAAFLGLLASGLTRFVLFEVSWRIGVDLQLVSLVSIIIVSFVVYIALIRRFIRHPQSGVVTFGQAALISLLELIMKVVLMAVFLLVLMQLRN